MLGFASTPEVFLETTASTLDPRPDDFVFEASFGAEPCGERAVGREAARRLAAAVFERVPDLHFEEMLFENVDVSFERSTFGDGKLSFYRSWFVDIRTIFWPPHEGLNQAGRIAH